MATSLLERQQTLGAPSLSTMVRGGTYVPNGPAPNAGVPTAPPISLSQVTGAVKTNPFSASVSPSLLAGSRSTAGVATTSGSATCTPANQTGSVTYSWGITTSFGNTVTANSPTSQTTTFSASVSGANDTANATATCTAHDNGSGGTYVAGTVNIALSYTGP